MPDPIRLTPRPEVRSTANPQPLQVTAQPVDQGSTIRPADNSNLTGLINGLSSFHPALERWTKVDDINKTQQADTTGYAASQRVEAKREELSSLKLPDSGIEGSYKAVAEAAFRRGISERMAIETKADIVAQYNDQKNRPDFDLNRFLAEHRQANLQGLDDDMAVRMGKSLGELEPLLRNDYEKVRMQRLDGQREEAISASLRNVITTDDPNIIAQKYRDDVLPVIQGLGKTKKEAASYLLNHLANLSDKAGGRPELFDSLLTHKDTAGFTIFDANPELQGHIQAAKQHATQLRDKAINESQQDGIALKLKELNERVLKDPYSVEFDELLGHMGKFNVFPTGHDVASYWQHILKARGDNAGQLQLLNLAKLGQLYLADTKDQKAIMGALTGTVVNGLSDAISKGDTSGVAVLADALVQAHRTAGSNEPSAPIERMFKFIGQGNATGDKPSPIFQAAAEVYRRLENSPQLREAYFDENSRKVMDAYIQGLNGQAEPGAAYKAAYETVSPEAKRREEAFKQTPEFKEKLQKATRWATGSSFWPRILGGNGRPENGAQLITEAQQYALDFLKRNPQATDDQVQAQTQSYIERSFVHDPGTGIAVKVPTGSSPELTQKALAAYTSKVSTELGLSERESGWGLVMLPQNINQGTYRVMTAFNGMPAHLVSEVKMQDLVEQHRKDTLWSPEDASVLKNAELAVTNGQPVSSPQFTSALAKAHQLKVQPDLVKKLEDYEFRSTTQGLKAVPVTDVTPDNNAIFKDSRAVKVDPKQAVSSAQRFLNTGSLAGSLITMGEGVSFSSYDDPAKGAGKNIGMGYNLKANEATAARDLRSAGVPAEQVQSIINGTGKLSPEQAERLVLVTVGRHEATAAAQVNALQPRLWERLQPQQRAVLTDIAYQTGDVGQFKKAISALVSGDMQKFQEESKVFYTNRDGQRVEDTRRNALRNAMLAGPVYWQSILQKQGAQASSPLDAVALNVSQ